MLMDNASKGIKQAIANIDMAIDGVIGRLYMHNMIFDPDPFLKGDFKVNTRGAMGLIAREQQATNKREFLAQTANPLDFGLMTPDGRRYLLKDVARTLQMDTEKLVPEPMPQPMQQQVPPGQEPPPGTPEQMGTPGGSVPGPGANDVPGGLQGTPPQNMLPPQGANPQPPQGVSPQGAGP